MKSIQMIMTPMLIILQKNMRCALLAAITMLTAAPAMAIDLSCTGPQMGEIFVDTETGIVTKSADETLKLEIATEKSNYRFEFKGKRNQFKALINRTNGQIILDEACTPQCWGGPIFGDCTPVKAKF